MCHIPIQIEMLSIIHITDITGITHNRKSQKIPQSENSLEKLYGGWFGWWVAKNDSASEFSMIYFASFVCYCRVILL